MQAITAKATRVLSHSTSNGRSDDEIADDRNPHLEHKQALQAYLDASRCDYEIRRKYLDRLLGTWQ